MNITIFNASPIPALLYGGTERVVWDLGKALVSMGHRVTYLAPAGSFCRFAPVVHWNPQQTLAAQIPPHTDLLHSQVSLPEPLDIPCLVTEHGNPTGSLPAEQNTVFVSQDHATRHGSTHFVRNGLDWSQYGPVDWDMPRKGLHFLGKAAWRLKNVNGAIAVAARAGKSIDVLGGYRLQIKRGFRLTLSRHARFHGMVGGETKNRLLNRSMGLVFPVRWHEPFGLAVIESLYFGCPVFATPYGALPELVPDNMGHLSANAEELAHSIRTQVFDRRALHHHAVSHFNAARMANDYVAYYERVLAGERLVRRPVPLATRNGGLPWQG